MLKHFTVSNFKGFKEELSLDLTSRNGYAFNAQCVKNGIVNNAMVYGYNGCGKSNLGLAIFDIIEHLTDNRREVYRYENYVNAASGESKVSFSYLFLLEGVEVLYRYQKTDYKTLVKETLSIDGGEVVSFDRTGGNTVFTCGLEGTETLNMAIAQPELSVLKYIKNNAVLLPTRENKAFYAFFSFIEKMLFFRSLEDRTYMFQDTGSKPITQEIIERGKVQDFEAFLNEGNVKCRLAVVKTIRGLDLAFDFGEKKLLLYQGMSTGTSSMLLFYYWFMRVVEDGVPFVFIDEFDAFYHFELARLIVKKLMESGIQFVLTTHNTSLLSNRLLRPDCYYLMGNNLIKPLSQCTDKEIREVHNIEKIYKAGGFVC